MAPVTIGVGVVLIVLGLIGFIPHQAPTALISAGFGAVIVALGVLARQDNMRKHAMHAAAMVGVLGFVGAAVMAVLAAVRGTYEERPWAFAMQICMALTCGVFVALCVKSFVDARRRRQQAGG